MTYTQTLLIFQCGFDGLQKKALKQARFDWKRYQRSYILFYCTCVFINGAWWKGKMGLYRMIVRNGSFALDLDE